MTSSMFSRWYCGKCANSAASHPKLRTISRTILLRSASVDPGNANCKLNSAICRQRGCRRNKSEARCAPTERAEDRGNNPRNLRLVQASAYSTFSRIRNHYGQRLSEMPGLDLAKVPYCHLGPDAERK